MITHCSRQVFRRSAGWTLIELIGVLAVITLLMGSLVPIMQSRLQEAVRSQERQRLRTIADTLRSEVWRTGQIPDSVTTAAFVASSLGWRESDVQLHALREARSFLWDPQCRLGWPTVHALPYLQGSHGSLNPARVRLLMLSSLGEPLPSRLTTGANLSPEEFETLWQWSNEGLPPNWSWKGQPMDLLMQRLDLQRDFIHCTFLQRDAPSAQLSAGSQPAWIMDAGLSEGWFLRGTPLRLMDAAGLLQVVEIPSGPVSWEFEQGRWRRAGAWTSVSANPSGRDFSEILRRFLGQPSAPGVPAMSSQRLVDAMGQFLKAYSVWWQSGRLQSPTSDSTLGMAHQELLSALNSLVLQP